MSNRRQKSILIFNAPVTVSPNSMIRGRENDEDLNTIFRMQDGNRGPSGSNQPLDFARSNGRFASVESTSSFYMLSDPLR